jgi:hypothetical protein
MMNGKRTYDQRDIVLFVNDIWVAEVRKKRELKNAPKDTEKGNATTRVGSLSF